MFSSSSSSFPSPSSSPHLTLAGFIETLQSLPHDAPSDSPPPLYFSEPPFLGQEAAVTKFWDELYWAQTHYSASFFYVGGMTGMGKSAFGRRALTLLKEHVARNPGCQQPSSVPNAELLENSLHITIDCGDDSVAVSDLDQASVWIAFQLLLCSGLLKPSAISALRSMKREDAARLRCDTGDVIRWLAEQQRGNSKTPLMIVVHVDAYPRLISRTSEKFVREVLYDMISQFYATPSTGIIVTVLLTSSVKPMLFPINQAVPNEIPLDPLDPDVVLNHLLVKYVDHPLLAEAAVPHSDVRRRWLVFLHDIGVVPIFLTMISHQLDNPDHSLVSLSSISSTIGAYAKNQCSKLVDHF